MKDQPYLSFGLVIAFLAPGVIAMWGAAQYSTLVKSWFEVQPRDGSGVAGFLFIGLVSLSAGVFISGLRWATVDKLMAGLGVKPPARDFSLLADADRARAFDIMVEGRYRYYQFYANSFVAMLVAYLAWSVRHRVRPWENWWLLIIVAISAVVLVFSAKDSLKHYYQETGSLLGGAHD